MLTATMWAPRVSVKRVLALLVDPVSVQQLGWLPGHRRTVVERCAIGLGIKRRRRDAPDGGRRREGLRGNRRKRGGRRAGGRAGRRIGLRGIGRRRESGCRGPSAEGGPHGRGGLRGPLLLDLEVRDGVGAARTRPPRRLGAVEPG